MSSKRHILCALTACMVSACHRVDQQFQAANYTHFGTAVYTECRYIQSGSDHGCRDSAMCVNLYILEHDNTEPLTLLSVYSEFTDGLLEFVYNEASAFEKTGEPVKPQGKISDAQRFLEYRLRKDGTILRWSPEAGDWMPTSRNIRNESLPARVQQLMGKAKIRGDAQALRLYQLFLEARRVCYLEGEWGQRRMGSGLNLRGWGHTERMREDGVRS